jgi:hypothetical protein
MIFDLEIADFVHSGANDTAITKNNSYLTPIDIQYILFKGSQSQ